MRDLEKEQKMREKVAEDPAVFSLAQHIGVGWSVVGGTVAGESARLSVGGFGEGSVDLGTFWVYLQ